tara:strand:+ start:2075 stop:2254 length:180 start_codon:yes stop_codon:yes gene_type:complete
MLVTTIDAFTGMSRLESHIRLLIVVWDTNKKVVINTVTRNINIFFNIFFNPLEFVFYIV